MSLGEGVGAKTRMLVDTALPFDGSSVNLEIISETISLSEEIINPDGLRGSRERRGPRSRRGRRTVSGSIVLPVTPAALAIFLPAALGANVASNVYNVADVLPEMQVLIDKGNSIYHVENLKVNTITISSQPGQAVTMTLACEAEDITGAQSWPGSPPSIADDPIFIHSDFADATIGATTFEILSAEITVNNFLTTDEFANSTTRDGRLLAQDREVTGTLEIDPISENATLIAGSLTSQLTMQAVSGTWTLTIAATPQYGELTPVTNGKGQRRLALPFQSRATSSLPSIRVTLASS